MFEKFELKIESGESWKSSIFLTTLLKLFNVLAFRLHVLLILLHCGDNEYNFCFRKSFPIYNNKYEKSANSCSNV